MESASAARSLVGIVGIAGAGALVWFAGRFDGATSHGYWISLAVLAAAGLVLGATLRLRIAAPAMAVVVAATLLVAFWVALAEQPTGGHVHTWSRELGIGGGVGRLGAHVGVLGFALAAIVAAAGSSLGDRRRAVPVPAPEPAPEDAHGFESADTELTVAR